jgi:hypothetical protein
MSAVSQQKPVASLAAIDELSDDLTADVAAGQLIGAVTRILEVIRR